MKLNVLQLTEIEIKTMKVKITCIIPGNNIYFNNSCDRISPSPITQISDDAISKS
mgnify:CR=1 FL=1